MIRFVDLDTQRTRIGDRIDRAIARVVDHGEFVMGPEVFELEERLAELCGARHAVSCSSGTDALLLALLAWGVGPGDAVFVPTFTFAATAEVVALVGATPVFVDVDSVSLNLDAASLADAVATERDGDLRLAGVVAVDLFGHPADYGAVEPIAAQHGMWLLADAAQSFGARHRLGPVGTLATATATSFFPAKPLGCYGDGGALFTDDEQFALAVRSLRAHGKGESKHDHVRIGMNGRLDTIQAAVLIEKLALFPDELALRRSVAERYAERLEDVVTTPVVASGDEPTWAQYTVRIERRDAVGEALASRGVPTAVYYPKPLHQQLAYEAIGRCPVGLAAAEGAAESVLSLPMHPYLSAPQQERVASAVRDAVAAHD